VGGNRGGFCRWWVENGASDFWEISDRLFGSKLAGWKEEPAEQEIPCW